MLPVLAIFTWGQPVEVKAHQHATTRGVTLTIGGVLVSLHVEDDREIDRLADKLKAAVAPFMEPEPLPTSDPFLPKPVPA